MFSTPKLTRTRFADAAITGAVVGVGISLVSAASSLLRGRFQLLRGSLWLLPQLAATCALYAVILLVLLRVARGRTTCMLAGFVASLPAIAHMAYAFPRAMGRTPNLTVDIIASTIVFGLLGIFFGNGAYESTVHHNEAAAALAHTAAPTDSPPPPPTPPPPADTAPP